MITRSSRRNGVLAVIGASCLYGVLPVFLKEILLEGMAESAAVFARFLLTAVFAFIIVKSKKLSLSVTRRQAVELTLAALIGYGLTATFLTAAYNRIPVGLATMFHFTNPMFVTLAMILIFKEKATVFKGVSIACAITGLILMTDFSSLDPTGILLATLSGITYAFYVIANKKCSFAELNSFVIVFYVGLINSLFFGARGLIAGTAALPPTLRAGVFLVILSLFCTICALSLLTYGIRTLGASTASVLNMLEPVVSLIAGMIVYHESATLKILAGCVLVVISGIIAVMEKPEA